MLLLSCDFSSSNIENYAGQPATLLLLTAPVPWYLFQKHCWHTCPLSSAFCWCFKVGKTSLEEELVEETGAVFLAQSSEQFCSSRIGYLAWSHKFLLLPEAELWPRISTKNCQTWACCEVIWSFLTQGSSPADFPHVLYLRFGGSLPWLDLDKLSLFSGSYPDSGSLRGRSVATPIICFYHLLPIGSGGEEWFQGSMLRICSVISQASSLLLNQDKLSHCCLFRAAFADELHSLWPVQTMTAAQIMTSRTVIVAKLFPYCVYQQHSSCHRHGFCLTPVLALYYADNLPVTFLSIVCIILLAGIPFHIPAKEFHSQNTYFLKKQN